MRIESDNPAIEKNLRLLEKTIMDNDGWVDPDLVIKSENGSISIEKHGPVCKKPLIALPTEMLLQTDKMGLSVKGDTISMNPEKGALTDLQLRLSEAMIEIYNLTKKIPIHKATHPWFMFMAAPQYMEMLYKGRTPNQRQKKIFEFMRKGEKDSAEADEFACETYIHTRTLGYKEHDEESNSDTMTTNIMPIVDFLNHDYRGAGFSFDKGIFKGQDGNSKKDYLTVADRRPVLTSNECYALYSQMDTMDAFMSYGFPDASTPIVRSVPLEIELGTVGKIVCNALNSHWKKGKLHKNVAGLRPFIPITMKKEEGLLELTHILVPCGGLSPHALRRVLRLMITNVVLRAMKSDEIWDQVLQAEEKILSTNIDFYKNLLADLENDKTNNDSSTEAGKCKALIKDIAQLQLTKLYKYEYGEEAEGAGQANQELAAAE